MEKPHYRRPLFQFFLGFFTRVETAINHVWGERNNFFYYLGSLPIILLFVLLFTGLFLFIYYNMSASSSYESVKYMTEQTLLGRFMRNLHRYAADAMMFFVILHLLRVLFEEKFENHRKLAWITGLIILALLVVQGISGYILPLDTTSRYVMEKTSEVLASLKVFGDTLPRSFSSPALLGKWIMWVMLIVHLIIPLFFVLLIFIHLLRISRAKIFPPKQITFVFLAVLVAYTLLFPLAMAGKAEAEKMPELTQPDWFYLFVAPIFGSRFSLYGGAALGIVTLGLFFLPWLVRRRKIVPAAVIADKCTGCGLCAIDCPYQAMHMVERSEIPAGGEKRHKYLVSIDTDLCSGCGICAGSCTYDAITFASASSTPGPIEVAGKWAVVVCQSRAHTLRTARLPDVALTVMPCSGRLGVSLAEEIRAAGAKGIVVGACPEGDCWYREGNHWLADRIALERKPNFRRVPAEFPILGIRFSGNQEKDFIRELGSIVGGKSYRGKPLPLRLFEFLKPSAWAYSFSLTTVALAALLWIFFLGASGRFGAIQAEPNTALMRIDFFYQTEKKTCSPEMIPPGAREAAIDRMAGLVKLDNLTAEARERILQQATDSVAAKYCSRARRNLDVALAIDGKTVRTETFKPSGFQNDGITYVLLKEKVVPGDRLVTISAVEADVAGTGRRVAFSEKLFLGQGHVKLVDFEPNSAKLFIRTTKPDTPDATGKE